MARPASGRLVMLLLSLNAIALLLVAVLLLSQTSILPAAHAQLQREPADALPANPPAPSGQFLLSPAQFATNVWGCYVLDTRSMTLCAYLYQPGEKVLRLQAARGVIHDLQLTSFNTDPAPAEVARLLQKERELQTGAPPGETQRK